MSYTLELPHSRPLPECQYGKTRHRFKLYPDIGVYLMEPIGLRLADPGDLDALLALESHCFEHDRLSRRSFRYFLTKSQAQLWVIGAPIIAYGLVLFHRGTSVARIYSLAVHSQARGQGLARTLVEAMERSARAGNMLHIHLEVAEDNHSALNLYRSLGYQLLRPLPGYYERGQDGLRMEKHLGHDRPTASNRSPVSRQTESSR